MATSSYNFDVNPQYRDAGCPSQCMSMNEYTTVGEYYSYGTDPKTALLRAMETPAASVPSTFSEDYRMMKGIARPNSIQPNKVPVSLNVATRYAIGDCLERDHNPVTLLSVLNVSVCRQRLP
jgi:hypothetical protein